MAKHHPKDDGPRMHHVGHHDRSHGEHDRIEPGHHRGTHGVEHGDGERVYGGARMHQGHRPGHVPYGK